MLVYGDSIAQWAQDRIDGNLGFDKPFSIGIIKDNRLVGAVIFDNYRPQLKSIFVSIVLIDKIVLTRTLIYSLFDYPFNTLNVNRVQAMINVNNTPSIRLCQKLGFLREGILREASEHGEDILLFGMLKRECKWLSGKNT